MDNNDIIITKRMLYKGDCLEIMRQLPDKSVDCVITDPPYILDKHGGGDHFGGRLNKLTDNISFITSDFDYENVFNEMIRLCKKVNILLFCSNKQLGRTITFFENKGYNVDTLVWSKINPIPACHNNYISDLEFIVYAREKGVVFNNEAPLKYKYKTKRYGIMSMSKYDKLHPTQKPEMLMQELISVHTRESDVVIDPFMGSGTTGIACNHLNRSFIGIEIDEHYFEISQNRIEGELL